MAYASSNPPNLIVGSFGGKPQLWTYTSTHTAAEMTTAAGFITNAQDLGIQAGDYIFGLTTANAPVFGHITEVSSTGGTVVLGTS